MSYEIKRPDPTSCKHVFERVKGWPRYNCNICGLNIPDWVLTSVDSQQLIKNAEKDLKFYILKGYYEDKGEKS